jgi:hypothetical protein
MNGRMAKAIRRAIKLEKTKNQPVYYTNDKGGAVASSPERRLYRDLKKSITQDQKGEKYVDQNTERAEKGTPLSPLAGLAGPSVQSGSGLLSGGDARDQQSGHVSDGGHREGVDLTGTQPDSES